MNVGTTVVDERLHQSITLRNNGALGTNYRLVKTSLLRTEQTKPKEEIPSEGSAAPLEKQTSTVSGSIRIQFYQ